MGCKGTVRIVVSPESLRAFAGEASRIADAYGAKVASIEGNRAWSAVYKERLRNAQAAAAMQELLVSLHTVWAIKADKIEDVAYRRMERDLRVLESQSLEWMKIDEAERHYDHSSGPARRVFQDVGIALVARLFPSDIGQEKWCRLKAQVEKDREPQRPEA